ERVERGHEREELLEIVGERLGAGEDEERGREVALGGLMELEGRDAEVALAEQKPIGLEEGPRALEPVIEILLRECLPLLGRRALRSRELEAPAVVEHDPLPDDLGEKELPAPDLL